MHGSLQYCSLSAGRLLKLIITVVAYCCVARWLYYHVLCTIVCMIKRVSFLCNVGVRPKLVLNIMNLAQQAI